MISRADAHRAAIHLIDALGPEAANAAHERTSEMLTLGDAGRYAVWSMILDAIEDILDQESPRRWVAPIDAPFLAGVELSAASRAGRHNRERNRG